MTTTEQTTCPSWCTSVVRFHDDTNAHDGPGWEVERVEVGAGSEEDGTFVVNISGSEVLTIDQAEALAVALGRAITWAREMSAPVPVTTGTHIFGCNLPPEHRGACLLDRPFRIRPEGGREYLGGDR